MKKVSAPRLSDDECDCPCHTGGAKHVMACQCTPCPYCARRIRGTVPIDDHAANCPRKPTKQPR